MGTSGRVGVLMGLEEEEEEEEGGAAVNTRAEEGRIPSASPAEYLVILTQLDVTTAWCVALCVATASLVPCPSRCRKVHVTVRRVELRDPHVGGVLGRPDALPGLDQQPGERED